MIAKELITPSVLPVKPTDTVAFTLNQMDECRLSHLPVVDGFTFLGTVADRDLYALHEPDIPVGTRLPALNRESVQDDVHVYEVIRAFSASGLTLMPVVDAREHYTGSITLPSLVKRLADMAAIQNPGGVIVLEINEKDYNVSEIARIVESADAKLLSLYVTSMPDSTRLEVTLKVNLMDIGTLLQTFNRYNYTVRATWSHQDAYSEGLQDRFDALMNYLSI